MKTNTKVQMIGSEFKEDSDLFVRAYKIANEKYQDKNFYEETSADNPFKILENHPASRTISPEFYNKMKNNEAKRELVDKIYNKLLFQRHLGKMCKNLLDFV